MATNAGKVMLPLQSLLNPTPRDSSLAPTSQPCITANRSSDIPPASYAKMQHSPSSSSFSVKGAFRPQPSQGRETSSILIKTKPRGPINYPPYEDLDEDALQLVQHFQVEPFGTINRGFQHIPYTSSKKDLFEKTGRESIEAFKYEFRVPGHERAYVVMWDYNIGIVRMNPFIKWGGYPKTKSSQILDKNPGLRDISPGVTGGAVSAQGYWVPFRCARALCATFCFPIAGALIPLFGPSFPKDCVRPDSPAYNEMLISRPLLVEDTQAAEISRRYYTNMTLAARNDIIGQSFPGRCVERPTPGPGRTAAHVFPPPQYDGAWDSHGMHRSLPRMQIDTGRRVQEEAMRHGPVRFTPINYSSPKNVHVDRQGVFAMIPTEERIFGNNTEPHLAIMRKRRLQEAQTDSLRSEPRRSSARHKFQRKKSDSPHRTIAHYDAAMVLVALGSKDEETKDGSDQLLDGAEVNQVESAVEGPRVKRHRAKSL